MTVKLKKDPRAFKTSFKFIKKVRLKVFRREKEKEILFLNIQGRNSFNILNRFFSF